MRPEPPQLDLRSDGAKQAAIVGTLRDSLGSSLTSVVLFGSQASGRARPNSDVDLLVVATGLPTQTRERDLMAHRLGRALFGVLGHPTQVILTDPAELELAVTAFNPLMLSLPDGHLSLLDTGGLFARAFDQLNALFASGRVIAEGTLRWRIPEWRVV